MMMTSGPLACGLRVISADAAGVVMAGAIIVAASTAHWSVCAIRIRLLDEISEMLER